MFADNHAMEHMQSEGLSHCEGIQCRNARTTLALLWKGDEIRPEHKPS